MLKVNMERERKTLTATSFLSVMVAIGRRISTAFAQACKIRGYIAPARGSQVLPNKGRSGGVNNGDPVNLVHMLKALDLRPAL